MDKKEELPQEDMLLSAIQQLSRKKQVVSEEALKAKEEFDTRKQQLAEDSRKSPKQLAIVEEFNHSVRLLVSIFQKSQFDELVMLVSNPSRVLILNFLVGILRGIGFSIGILLVVVAITFFFFQGKDMDIGLFVTTIMQCLGR